MNIKFDDKTRIALMGIIDSKANKVIRLKVLAFG